MTQTTPAATSSQEILAVGTILLEELPDGVFVTDLAGRILLTNSVFLSMMERRRAEVWNQPLLALLADEDVLTIVGFESVFGEGRVQDVSVIFALPSGSTLSLLLSAFRSSDGYRIVFTARTFGSLNKELSDVSKWAVLEQERAIEIASARDALAKQNEALEAARSELQSAYEQLQQQSEAREKLEQELRLAQKLEAIGQLAAGVAHEINTPMQYIGDNIEFLRKGFDTVVGYAEQLQASLDGISAETLDATKGELRKLRRKARLDFLVSQIPSALNESKGGVEHVSSIVRAMKSFTHVDQGEKALGDINQAIRDVLAVAQSEYKSVARVVTELQELPPMHCFIGKLNQVFLNLIVNAAHAIGDAKRSELGTITVRSRQVGSFIELDFVDSGCGIPEAIRERIYDQFFTTKEVGRGTGQGLALARTVVVDGHGGTISLSSEVGVGSTFTLRLPLLGLSLPVSRPSLVTAAMPT